MFLPKICQNLSTPVTSSPANGSGLALSILSTIFNILPADSEVRYHVLLAILRVIRATTNFEYLRPQLKQLDTWLQSWDVEEEEQRKLYLAVSDSAAAAGEVVALSSVSALIPNGDMGAIASWADEVRDQSAYRWSGVGLTSHSACALLQLACVLCLLD